MIGTQETAYLQRCYLGEVKAIERCRTERFIHIPMPWTRMMYTICNDDYKRQRPVFAIYWYKPAHGSLSIRLGWTSRDP